MLSLELETKCTVGAVLGLNNSFPNSKAEGLVKEETLDLSVRRRAPAENHERCSGRTVDSGRRVIKREGFGLTEDRTEAARGPLVELGSSVGICPPFRADDGQAGSYRFVRRIGIDKELYRKRTGATVSVSLHLGSSLSIQPFEGSRFVRGGRYGISIDFGLEVVEKQSVCGTIFESEFIELTKKLKLRIASS